MKKDPSSARNSTFLKWLKKIGLWGFLFFLLKGLLWLLLGYLALK
ncbi:hypothetical protein B0O44_101784 [Pedobacter nutrimenti]|jgi:hypothetical protein|uniref:Alanyl-tRNA synthetase n=1 Tax=Pedobacter nutrimenti TaxID=1241337 RepID=A0A318UMU2_9SPHI|nr:hypothetical protein B0O44_101784 [Pedobacter nutrimenti]